MASRQGMASSTPLCSQPEGTWCSSCISEILPKTETESSQKAPATSRKPSVPVLLARFPGLIGGLTASKARKIDTKKLFTTYF